MMELTTVLYDAELLLGDVLDRHEPAFKRKGAALKRELHCGSAYVMETGGPLCAALSQALAYALKCALPGGTVRVRARCEDAAVRIEIEDGRAGLSVQQISAAYTREFSTSLDLGLARRIIGELGGQVALQHDGWSAGYLLSITLPYLWRT